MVSASKANRTITYQRAAWGDDGNDEITFKSAIDICLRKLPSTEDTRQNLGDVSTAICNRKIDEKHIYIHLARWANRQAVSTVPIHRNKSNVGLQSEPPGEDWEYLVGDGMMLISDDHCLVSPSGLPQSAMRNFIASLLKKIEEGGASLPNKISRFNLFDVAKKGRAQELANDGIKKIDINIGGYHETYRDIESKGTTRIEQMSRKVLDMFCGYLRADSREEIEKSKNVCAHLVIKIDGRGYGLSTEEFGKAVKPIITESPHEVDIVTKSGLRIKRDDLILKKQISVAKSSSTVSYTNVWAEMKTYLDELRSSGSLEK